MRHTYGSSLVNAGMSLQALMALMGHVSPEMTLRYASLSSPTVRAAYEAAMSKVRGRQYLLVVPVGKVAVPDRVEWLRSEMLKTRVAHGYCSRHLVAEACSYANVCEQCDNFVTTPEFVRLMVRWFGCLTDQKIRRGAHKSVQAPEADIRSWIKSWNDDPKPFVWKKSAEEILDSLARYLKRTSGAGH